MRVAAILAVTLAVIGITLYLAYRKEAKGPAAQRVIVLLIIVALLQAANAYLAYLGTRPPTTPGTFEDSFARVPLFPYDTRFTILNADEDLWSRPDQEDCLTLWTHRGDTWGKRGEHREPKNIVVRECTAEKFEVSATVRSFAPIADWQQGGVIVFADLDNYVRVTLATWQSGTSSN